MCSNLSQLGRAHRLHIFVHYWDIEYNVSKSDVNFTQLLCLKLVPFNNFFYMISRAMTFARLCSRLVKCASSVMLELVFTISRKYFNVYWRNVTAKQKYELTPAFWNVFILPFLILALLKRIWTPEIDCQIVHSILCFKKSAVKRVVCNFLLRTV